MYILKNTKVKKCFPNMYLDYSQQDLSEEAILGIFVYIAVFNGVSVMEENLHLLFTQHTELSQSLDVQLFCSTEETQTVYFLWGRKWKSILYRLMWSQNLCRDTKIFASAVWGLYGFSFVFCQSRNQQEPCTA